MRASSSIVALAFALSGLPGIVAAQESEFAPPIDLWLDQVSYDRGARIRPHFTTEPGAYVTVLRVTSDGELRVMYPARPSQQQPFVIGQFAGDMVPYASDPSSNLYESSGTGYVFAIASYQRFDYSYFTQGRSWSTAKLATFGRYAEPFQAMRQFVDQVLPQSADFSLDYEVYEVYSRTPRSTYASRYAYSSVSAYHDACLSAFGIRYSYYCRSYGGLYYGPIVIGNPRRIPTNPRTKNMSKPRDLTHYPNVPTIPLDPKPTQGRFPDNDAAERAARERYERTQKKMSPRSEQPRGEQPFIYRTLPPAAAPARTEARGDVRPQSHTEMRAQPQPRVEGRFPTHSEPRAPARVEVRNEPRAERPAPPPPPPAPAKPDKKN